jgi:hypothetical protein
MQRINIDNPDHAAKLTDLPDEQMNDILPTLKKLAIATVSGDSVFYWARSVEAFYGKLQRIGQAIPDLVQVPY